MNSSILSHTDGLIFDIDGTLWDSTPIVARAWNEYLIGIGHPELSVTADILKTVFGQTLPDIARKLFPGFPEDEQMHMITKCCDAEHDALYKTPAPLFEGLTDVLSLLSRRYPLFIVSNCQAGYIELFLEVTGLSPLFRDHLCPGDTGVAKAANIRTIASRHSLHHPVYIGDTQGDLNACKDAGVPFVYASYGFGTADTPDAVIKRPADLPSLFLIAGKGLS